MTATMWMSDLMLLAHTVTVMRVGEFLFLVFSLGALGFQLMTLLDALDDRRYIMGGYSQSGRQPRPEDRVLLDGHVRNEWLRLAMLVVIEVIAVLMVVVHVPRPPEVVLALVLLAALAMLILLIGTILDRAERIWLLRRLDEDVNGDDGAG